MLVRASCLDGHDRSGDRHAGPVGLLVVMSPRALKVFRTSIGFHDAYVAVPSRKAALEAWGSKTDLFAVGLAEQVSDRALMAEPLTNPGKVIRRVRGTASEHLRAATPEPATPKQPARTRNAIAPAGPPPVLQHKHRPRPSADELERLELVLHEIISRQKAEEARIDERLRSLQLERDQLRIRHADERNRAETAVETARRNHAQALEAWLDHRNG